VALGHVAAWWRAVGERRVYLRWRLFPHCSTPLRSRVTRIGGRLVHDFRLDQQQHVRHARLARLQRAFLIVALLLLARASAAQDPPHFSRGDWFAVAANVSGQALDGVSTQRFLHNGSGCTESNPALGPTPTAGQISVTKIIAVAGFTAMQAMLHWARVSDPGQHPRVEPWAKWSSRGFGLLSGAIGARSGIRNLRLCGW
jgi:hypothetical protein